MLIIIWNLMTSMTMRMKTLSYKVRISGPTTPMSSHHDHISNWYSNRDMIVYKFGGHLGYFNFSKGGT